MRNIAMKLPLPNRASSEACKRLGHYPSDTVDGSLGAFETRLPSLTASSGPRPSSLLMGEDRSWGLPWDNLVEFIDVFLGSLCVSVFPLLLFFVEFTR